MLNARQAFQRCEVQHGLCLLPPERKMTVASPNKCLKMRCRFRSMGFIPTISLGEDRLWVLVCIPLEIPLGCQGDFDFHWELGILPAHGLLEIPPGSISMSASLNLPTGFL